MKISLKSEFIFLGISIVDVLTEFISPCFNGSQKPIENMIRFAKQSLTVCDLHHHKYLKMKDVGGSRNLCLMTLPCPAQHSIAFVHVP